MYSTTIAQGLLFSMCSTCMTNLSLYSYPMPGVFFEEIQDSHFPRKEGYLGTRLFEFGEKGDNFDVQCFTMKKDVHLG